jgi:hypothetical protein
MRLAHDAEAVQINLVVMPRRTSGGFGCEIRHEDWRIRSHQTATLQESLTIGRDPGKKGLVIGPSDPYISSRAIQLVRRPDGVEIRNTSSHAEIDVQQSSALRHIFPGEGIVMISSFVIFVPSKDFTYQVRVTIEGLEATEQHLGATRSLLSQKVVVSEERLPALAGLCASFLFPGRFGTAPLKASQIAAILTTRGHPVTAKAVKHKIQRTKDQVEQVTGNYVDDREGLAQFLIRNRIVTAEHVKQYLIGDVSGDES